MSVSNFLVDTINTASKAGISIKFLNEYTSKYKGFFDTHESTLTIYLADEKGNPEPTENWLSVLAHEASHMDQHIEEAEVWNSTTVGNLTIESIIDNWLDYNLELTPKQLTQYIDKLIACELDCEKRTVAKIKKYRLPIDSKIYIKHCNCVLYLYEAIKSTRSWTKPGKGPMSMPDVLALMPDTFQKNYKDKKIIDAIISTCYEVSK